MFFFHSLIAQTPEPIEEVENDGIALSDEDDSDLNPEDEETMLRHKHAHHHQPPPLPPHNQRMYHYAGPPSIPVSYTIVC